MISFSKEMCGSSAWKWLVSVSGKNQYTPISGKTSVLSSNQQLHLFLSKCLLEELRGKKRVGDTCVRESDAPNWAHGNSRT